ncbi:MAG: thiamine pyrophosphate-dependent enzyme [Candidatus Falkowbacteria bacterium]
MSKNNERSPERWIRPGQTDFCPGCGYGTILNYLARALEKTGADPATTVAVGGIGCAAWIPDQYMQTHTLHTTHGRPIAFATGVKLAKPELNVLVISGDGDLATIGTNHLIHAARRDLDITVFCVNNFVYGMTGGQAGGTTPTGAVTSTTPSGHAEKPLDLMSLVLAAGGNGKIGDKIIVRFAAREIVLTRQPQRVVSVCEQALAHRGFSFVELIAPCATHFNRKNRINSVSDLKAYLSANYISASKAAKTPLADRAGKQLCGIFSSLGEYMTLVGGAI